MNRIGAGPDSVLKNSPGGFNGSSPQPGQTRQPNSFSSGGPPPMGGPPGGPMRGPGPGGPMTGGPMRGPGPGGPMAGGPMRGPGPGGPMAGGPMRGPGPGGPMGPMGGDDGQRMSRSDRRAMRKQEKRQRRRGNDFDQGYGSFGDDMMGFDDDSSSAALLDITRPLNFPGVAAVHALGAYLALQDPRRLVEGWRSAFSGNMVFETNIMNPLMHVTLFTLLLGWSTSMATNFYYDLKYGRDTIRNRRLLEATSLPPHKIRNFLSGMYYTALMSVSFLPGIPTRLSVVSGMILAYWNTKYWKDRNIWLNDVISSALISLTPFVSASAAIHLASQTKFYNNAVFQIPALWRLMSFMFLGTFGREIMFHRQQYEYMGKSRSSIASLSFGLKALSAIVASVIPYRDFFAEIGRNGFEKMDFPDPVVRRFLLVTAGCIFVVKQGVKAMKEGRHDYMDPEYMYMEEEEESVERSLLDKFTPDKLLFLASFV